MKGEILSRQQKILRQWRKAVFVCPFCGDDEFDAFGLKNHLTVFGCIPFERCVDGSAPSIDPGHEG